ncbi:Putative galactose mutarotase [Elusimicrobium minutum Pei191]|uniref:Putative galactose mutarotase n=1 Tax=Elusimicrobium minutum (strain Pei191) TaxID=445932 RepID=B2KC39_ELUMP|nr:galactose mutarotase [Elusimicrobium minutum]ACC98166.1 Putative galactose mutarotase [Elusimicrobium minutum Pei191]
MKKSIYKGLNSIVFENGNIRAEFLPDYAAKMVSLQNKKTDKEFLFQSDLPALKIPPYSAPFSEYDSSGFDEVFPSIDRCPYPSGSYAGVIIPDHGEVWAMSWEIGEITDNGFKASVKSKTLPYIFTRETIIKDNEITFNYTVTNTSDKEEFKFIWALHCLLACSPQTRLLTPEDLTKVMTVEHSTKTLGPWGTIHNYPYALSTDNKKIDLSATESKESNSCEKFYFLKQNTEGWCGVEHQDTGDKLVYKYDADKVPYLGVWKTQGGYRGDYNIALEPCTGVYDDLYVADKIKKLSKIPPHGEYSWQFKMVVS